MNQLITAVILTYNEEIHLERCINSLKRINARIIIVDSYSTDSTLDIGKKHNATIYQNKWINYGTQYNWALNNCEIVTEWTLRIDADEILDDKLVDDINSKLPYLNDKINGVYFLRGLGFLGKSINNGGMQGVYHLKLWRTGHGYCEPTWMDEHIKLHDGDTVRFKGKLIDDNLSNIHSFVDKHNGYATREAINYFNLLYSFNKKYEIEAGLTGSQDVRIKYFKNVYYKLPMFLRAFIYFGYRYIFQLGFLDGTKGFIYHFLQGLWYRLLVDFKVYEVRLYTKNDPVKIVRFFKENYNYDIEKY